MPDYRIFTLSPENRITSVAEEVEYDSDQDVIRYANAKQDGLDLEIWHGQRLVIRLTSTDK
jgi:hypothetical protein